MRVALRARSRDSEEESEHCLEEVGEAGHDTDGALAGEAALAGGVGLALALGLGLADELEGAAGGLLGLAGPARLLVALLGELLDAALEDSVPFLLGLVEAPGDAGELEPEGALVLAVHGGARHVGAVVVLADEGAGVSLYMRRGIRGGNRCSDSGNIPFT